MKKVIVKQIDVNFNIGGDYETFKDVNISDSIEGNNIEEELSNKDLPLYDKVLDCLEEKSVVDEYGEINDQLDNAHHYGFNLTVEVDGVEYYVEPTLVKGKRGLIKVDSIQYVEEC